MPKALSPRPAAPPATRRSRGWSQLMSLVAYVRQRLANFRFRATEMWRTSLQVRVIGTILLASATVTFVLGLILLSVMGQRLVSAKLDIASSEIDRARVTVEQQIAATDTSNTLQVRLNSARAVLTNRTASTQTETAAVFEPVLLVTDADGSGVVTSPEGYRIPERLKQFVSKGQVSYQHATITKTDGGTFKALIIGSPTGTDIPGLQVYLVLSLENEQATMKLMRGMFSLGGVVLVGLLLGIAWILTNQVTGPVRSASRIAQRFAAGHLRERMVVEGEDEMARLAMSFNSMAESISRQIRQLEEYGNLQQQFTSDVSHELRTPLTTVRMAADMIADSADELDPVAKRASELLITELDRFEELLGDLLEISRHDAATADLEEATFDLRATLESAWSQVSHLSVELGVPVTFVQPEAPVSLSGDPRRVERILRNLLSNAIDHAEGAPVTVTVGESVDAVAVTVADQGVGLKEGQEELVFNRFWRADKSRKRHSGGTGLGLAISREDAHLHGGRLEAVGVFGVGSTFRLTLPKKPGERYATSPLPLEVVRPGADKQLSPAPAQKELEA